MKVLDEEGLKNADEKKKKKKQQYDVKYQVENNYRVKFNKINYFIQTRDIEKQLKKEKNLETKIFYDHFKEQDNRGTFYKYYE